MGTTSLNISLPETLKDKVHEQVDAHRYSNASDYVRHLIRRDVERQEAQAELRGLLQAGLDSGISDQTPDEVFAELKSYIDSKL